MHVEVTAMTSITIRDLPEETLSALRARAALSGRSAEAEILAILESVARPEGRVQLGSLLLEIGREAAGIDLQIDRGQSPPSSVVQSLTGDSP